MTTWFKRTDLAQVIYRFGLCIGKNLKAGIMSLTQETYISQIFATFGMNDTKGVDTLIAKKDIVIYLDPNYYSDPSTVTKYQQLVEFLIYTMIETRFDIVFAVSTVSSFANNSGLKHVAIVKCIF